MYLWLVNATVTDAMRVYCGGVNTILQFVAINIDNAEYSV